MEKIKEEERLEKEKLEKEKEEFKKKFNSEKDKITEEINETKKRQLINSFNSRFEFFSGSKVKAVVSNIIDEVIKNNQKDKDHKIEVVFDNNYYGTDMNELRKIKSNLKNFNNGNIQYYEVNFDYDDDGYINKVVIYTN